MTKKFIRYRGYKIPKTDTVRTPKKKLGLPCEDQEIVSVMLCIRAKCEHLVASMAPYCQLYFDEVRRKRKKPPPFSFPQGIRTPSDGTRGWYGRKNVDGSGRFV